MSYGKNLFKALIGKSVASEGAVSEFLSGKQYKADRADAALVAKNISWVYAMIDRNAKAVSDQTLRLFAKKPTSISKSRFPSRPITDKCYKYLQESPHLQKFISDQADVEEITDHPFLDVIHKSVDHYTRWDRFYLLTSSLETTGNAYWHKVFKGDILEEITPLLPQLVTPIADKTNFLSHYEYGIRNQKIKIPPKKMVHYKYASLRHPFLGSGPLGAGLEAADLSIAMNTFEVGMFQNGGTPDIVLKFPKDVVVHKDEKKRIRNEYRRSFTRPHNSGKMMILTEGGEISPYSISPKDMSYLKGREWSMKELAAIFGVPVTFFVLDGVVKANLVAAVEIYMRMTIKPKLTTIEEVMNSQLIPDFDENLFVAYDNPVPEDVEQRLKTIDNHLNNKYSSINEERFIDGLDPVPWGDVPVEPQIPEAIQIDTEKLQKKTKRRFPSLQMPAANFVPDEFVAEMAAFFRRQGKVILSQAADAEFKSVKVAEDIVGPWFDMRLWDNQLTETIRPFVRASIIQAGKLATESIFPDRIFNESDPRLIAAMERRIPSIRGINRTTQGLVRQTVADGIAAGEAGGKIQRRIRDVFSTETDKDIGRYRAVRIARTETIWAFNEGAVLAYKQTGVVNQVQWLTAEDERVCEWCDPMDGRIQTLGQNFFQLGDSFEGRDGGILRFQMEAVEHPPLHPQCRCSLAPIV